MSLESLYFQSAQTLADDVKSGNYTASEILDAFLSKIDLINPELNAYTTLCIERAKQQAKHVDQKRADGKPLGALAGVPFAVKNLFDIRDVVTVAGSKINRDNAPAQEDAVLIQRLEAADAILLGALNMGEYAYDFTGENAHDGNCHNPWAKGSMSGGSSSGSGSATAAGLAPISLGSDTNGSIRVPASLCGLFGLKPTYGRLPRTGTYPFSDSLDHLGPLARTPADLALAFDALQGHDDGDHGCAKTTTIDCLSSLNLGIDGLRFGRLGGYFDTASFPQAQAAMDKVCAALGDIDQVELPGTEAGRSAAYLITNVEGARLHDSRLKSRIDDFDPDTRDRFLAGAMLPSSWYVRSQQVRHWYKENVKAVFEDYDVLIAPATPCTAPKMGQKTIEINGESQMLRPNLGYFTQPISALGLPSCVVPTMNQQTGLPIGIQIIAAPWREDLCLRVAAYLEAQGFDARIPDGLADFAV